MQAPDDDHIAYVITLCQQKGGVGKTTTAAGLGVELAKLGNKCLMLDLAPSGNLTSAFGIQLNQVQQTTADLFHGTYTIEELIKPTSLQGLSLIPSNASLSPVARELYQQPDYELVLQRILRQSPFSDYDILILDCPPGVDSMTLNAMACADLAIIPLECEPFALETLNNMFRLVKLSRERANPNISYRLLITKMNPQNTLHERIYFKIKDNFTQALLETTIGIDTQIPEGQLIGVPIGINQPQSGASQQYQSLTKEIMEIINVE